MKVPNFVLTEEETKILIQKAQNGDSEARRTLVEGHMRLATKLASKMKKDRNLEDIIQVGCIGLIKAVDQYNLEYTHINFSTYAVHKIIGEIKRYYRDQDDLINVGRTIKELSPKVHRLYIELEQKLQRKPTIEQMARILETSEHDVQAALHYKNSVISIDSPFYPNTDGGESNIVWADMLSSNDNTADEVLNNYIIEKALNVLNDKERFIIVNRFWKGKSQLDVGKMLGVSQVHVGRTEKKILAKIREQLQIK